MNTLRNLRNVIKMCKNEICRKETEFFEKTGLFLKQI